MKLNPEYYSRIETKLYKSEPRIKVCIRLSAESRYGIGDYRFEAKVHLFDEHYVYFYTSAESIENDLDVFIVELAELISFLQYTYFNIEIFVRRFVPTERRRVFHDAIINEYEFTSTKFLEKRILQDNHLTMLEQSDNIFLIPLTFKYYQQNGVENILLNPHATSFSAPYHNKFKEKTSKFKGWYAGYDLNSINVFLTHEE